MKALRRAYFADAGEAVARYGVRFECIVQHLWDGRRIHGRISLASVRCIDDLAHAAACCERYSGAVDDLERLYTRWLVRHSSVGSLLGEIDSLLVVRRLWAILRGTDESKSLFITLRTYTGVRPLRFWLLDHLERIVAEGIVHGAAGGPQKQPGSTRAPRRNASPFASPLAASHRLTHALTPALTPALAHPVAAPQQVH